LPIVEVGVALMLSFESNEKQTNEIGDQPFLFKLQTPSWEQFQSYKSKKSSTVPHKSRINFKNRKSSLGNHK